MQATPAWAHLLDEIAIHPDPISWVTVGGLRVPTLDLYQALQHLEQDGMIVRAGIIRDQWTETTWRLTKKGEAVWRAEVLGRRRRPGRADPVPRFSKAQLALAMGPRDVFDLVRVPWHWNKGAEQRAIGVQR